MTALALALAVTGALWLIDDCMTASDDRDLT